MIVLHGCSKSADAHAIMKDGVLRGRANQERHHLAPLANRVYFTGEARYAAIYALGGVLMEHEYSPRDGGKDPIGYVFKAEVSPDRCIPDEDCVGWIVSEIKYVREGKPVSPYCDNPTLAQALRDDPGMAESLAGTISSNMTARQLRNAQDGLTAYQAQGGKRALPHLSAHQKRWMIDHGAHFSQEGEVRWREVWEIDKRRSAEIKRDGSNLFAIATLKQTQAPGLEPQVFRVNTPAPLPVSAIAQASALELR